MDAKYLGEHPDEVSVVLGGGRHQKVILQEAEELRGEGPACGHLLSEAILFFHGLLGKEEPDPFLCVNADNEFNLGLPDVFAVLEEPMEDQSLAVLGRGLPLTERCIKN